MRVSDWVVFTASWQNVIRDINNNDLSLNVKRYNRQEVLGFFNQSNGENRIRAKQNFFGSNLTSSKGLIWKDFGWEG